MKKKISLTIVCTLTIILMILFTIFSFNKMVALGFISFAIIFQLFNIAFQKNRQETFLFTLILLISIINIYLNHVMPDTIVSNKTCFYVFHISYYLVTLLVYLFVRKTYQIIKFTLFDTLFLFICIVLFLLITILPFNILKENINFINFFNLGSVLFIVLLSLFEIKKKDFYPFISLIIIIIFIGNLIDLILIPRTVITTSYIYPIVAMGIAFIYSAIEFQASSEKLVTADELVSLNEKIRDTEFAFLNSQIQSHFIYNTLNSVQALTISDPQKAAELIEDFSSYLRTRLEFNQMPLLIEFTDELNHIRTYLNIEQTRFGERVNVEYNITISEFMIPPLTIQPLVENAIKHGLSNKIEGVTVYISTYEDDKNIYIEVKDDGVGFDKASEEAAQGVGTKNITNRLSLHLNASLNVASSINEGTISIITIPKNKKM